MNQQYTTRMLTHFKTFVSKPNKYVASVRNKLINARTLAHITRKK